MRSDTEKRLHEEVGARIRKCLEVRYETQAELASSLGISEPAASLYLSGKHVMPYTLLIETARHLGVSIHYLLGEEAKEDGGDLRDACNKRIAEGYEIIWRFDPHDTGTLCGYLGDVMEGIFHMDTLHAACGIPLHVLGKWRSMIREEGWGATEKDMKKYLEGLDNSRQV